MKRTIIFLISTILSLIVIIYSFFLWYNVSVSTKENVTGWFEQAQNSADATQMRDFLDKTLMGMEKLNLTQGYSSYFYHTPDNDISIDYQVLKTMRDRTLDVEKYPIGSMDYAKSIENMRDQLSKITFNPYNTYLFNNHYAFQMFWIFGHWILWIWDLVWFILLVDSE